MPKKSKKIRDLQVLKAQNDSNTAFDENHLDEAIEVRISTTTSEIVASNFGASLTRAILDEMFSTPGPNLDATIILKSLEHQYVMLNLKRKLRGVSV